MDPGRFDALTRHLSTSGSRRRALAALGGALGVLGWHGGDDTRAHDPSKKCKKKSGKAKKTCLKKAKKHSATHASETATVPPFTCQGQADFTPCGGGKQCSGGVCATP